MKRTKEAYFRPNPSILEAKDSSGLTCLLGEDVPNYHRTKEYQQIQKEYLDEQIKEKQQIKNNVNNTNHMFDQQTLENNRQRGQLEFAKKNRVIEMERAHDDYNTQLANERKNREKQERERELEEEKRELELLNQRKVKRVLPNNR